MTQGSPNHALDALSTTFSTIPLKYGVERKTEKTDGDSVGFPTVSLDMVESWTGEIIESKEEEGDQVTTGLVKFRENDVLFSKLRPYLAKVFVAEYTGAASPEFIVLQPTKFKPRYLFYVLASEEFVNKVDASTYGAKMPRASWDFIGEVRVPNPPIKKQKKIVDYLDNNVSEIDVILKKKRKLINRLAEKKEGIVSKGISTGFQDNLLMEDVDVPWVSQLPAEWEFAPVRYLSTHVTSGPRDWASHYESKGSPFLRVTNLQSDKIEMDLDDLKYVSSPDNQEAKRAKAKPGDILVAITGATICSVGIVPDDIDEAYINQHTALVRPKKDIHPKWLAYCFFSPMGQEQLQIPIRGGTKEGLGLSDVKNIRIPVPNYELQKEIASMIDSKVSRLDDLALQLQKSSNVFREKRKVLITKAVTGQIDLSDWQPPDGQEALP